MVFNIKKKNKTVNRFLLDSLFVSVVSLDGDTRESTGNLEFIMHNFTHIEALLDITVLVVKCPQFVTERN